MIETSLRSVGVECLETVQPLVMDCRTPVSDVIRQMRLRRSSSALLTAESQLVGIFTEKDYVSKVLGSRDALTQAISVLMTADPVTVGTAAPIREVVSKMYESSCHHIPVVDAEGRVVKCVRQRDIAEYLVTHLADRLLNLPPDPEQRAKTPEGG
jgi:CBS domain-containing protein